MNNDRNIRKNMEGLEVIPPAIKEKIDHEVDGLKFTKNFRSATTIYMAIEIFTSIPR